MFREMAGDCGRGVATSDAQSNSGPVRRTFGSAPETETHSVDGRRTTDPARTATTIGEPMEGNFQVFTGTDQDGYQK